MTSRLELLRSFKERITQQLEMSGVRYWKPKVGSNAIRILPCWDGNPESLFFKSIYTHFNVGEQKKRVVCPSTEGRTDCPICQLVDELYKSGVADDEKDARALQKRERFVINVLDLNSQEKNVPLVYEMGPTLLKDILFIFTDGEYGSPDSPATGRTIKIERSGTGLMDTKYIVMPAAHESAIDISLIKEIPNLDHIYKAMSVTEIERVLLGGVPESQHEEEAEEEFLPPVTTSQQPAQAPVQAQPPTPVPAPAPAPVQQPAPAPVQQPAPAPRPSIPAQASGASTTAGGSKTQFNLRERLAKLRTEKSG